jgi:FAD synthase
MLNILDEIKGNADRRVILPGSFNPLHEGHLRLLEIACRYDFDLILHKSFESVQVPSPCLHLSNAL